MMQWNRRTKLWVGYGLILAMMVAIGVQSLWSAYSLAAKLDEASTIISPSISHAAALERVIPNTLARLESLVASAGRQEAENVTTGLAYLVDREQLTLKDLSGITADEISEPIRPAVLDMEGALAAWWRSATTARQLAVAGQQAQAVDALAVARPLNDRAVIAAHDLRALLDQQLADLATDGQRAYRVEQAWLGVLLMATLIVIGSRLRAAEKTNHQLETMAAGCLEGGNDLSTAAAQVSTSSQALAQTASEQAASLEETSATMEELASMTKQNAERAQQVAILMRDAERKAVESNHAMTDATSSMTAIEDASHRVARILKTIDEITFQTNILALNAAVEAARAGDAGLGFSAVAEEVRNLAQRSASAARETATLVEESVIKSRDGRQRVEQLGAALTDIVAHVIQVRQLVDDVNTASQQQAEGISQVSEAIAQMEQVTQTIATTSEENAAASEEVRAQSGVSLKVALDLHRLVHSNSEKRSAAPAAVLPAVAPRPELRNVVTLDQPGAKGRAAPDWDVPRTGTYRRF